MLFLLYIPLILARQFDDLRFAFNQGRSSDIYHMLADEAKAMITEEVFVAGVDHIRNTQGEIIYWVDGSDTFYYFSVAFSTHLAAGFMAWTSNEANQLLSFQLQDFGVPSMVQFIKENPSKASMTVYENKNVLLDYFGERLAPLASVLKIPIACEFAKQISMNKFDLNKRITLTQLNRFYIKQYDTGHQYFLQYCEKYGKVINNTISMWDIAEGMIMFSSNCNSEFLQTTLGLKNIDIMIQDLDLVSTNSTYLVSNMLAFMNLKNLTHDKYLQSLKEMTFEQLIEKQKIIHDQLYDRSAQAQYMLENAYLDLFDPEVLEIQVQYFPYSTTNSYAQVLQKLNLKSYPQFNDLFYDYFYDLLGSSTMQAKVAFQQFTHAGYKGGSSALVGDPNCLLNMAFYDQFKSQIVNNLSRTYVVFMNQLDYGNDYARLTQQSEYFRQMMSYNSAYYKAVCTYVLQ